MGSKRVTQFLPVFLLFVFGAGIYFNQEKLLTWLKDLPSFSVRKVELEINPAVEGLAAHEDFLHFAGLDLPRSLLDIRIHEVENRLLSIPGLKRVEVRRQFPDTLHLKFALYLPKAILSMDRLYYVDSEGVIFKVLSAADTKDYPLITGISRGFYVKEPGRVREAIRHTLDFLAFLESDPQAKKILAVRDISEFHLENVFSGMWSLSLFWSERATEICFGVGDLAEMQSRSQRFFSFVSASGEDVRNYARIDLRFSDQVVGTPRIPLIREWKQNSVKGALSEKLNNPGVNFRTKLVQEVL